MKLLPIRSLGVAAALFGAAGFAAGPVQAQQGTVAGQVTDKSNQQPVAGASVLVLGTSLQARTGREGRYSITNVPPGQYQVQVRFIGFATGTQAVTVAAGQPATLDFALTPAAVPLDVVVVSATGQEQLKRELGNNVGTIDASKIAQEAAPVSAADLLNSRVPGVEVMQSGGTTGTGSRIRIRGATSLSLRNEPIIVVDGVRIDNVPNADGGLGASGGQAPSRLNDLNPEDWESVEVVKGPSAAALYGTDAANGVIQIRTKQGRPGPTKWTAFTEGGTLNDETNWPTNYFAHDTSTSCFPSFIAIGACPSTVAQVVVDSFNPLKQRSPFRQGVRQHYGLSAAGGNEITTFYVSGDFQREKGIFESNDLRKTSLRANLRNQVSRLLDIGISTAYVSSALALPQNDNNSFGILPSGLLGGTDSTVNDGYGFLTPQQAELIQAGQRIERFTGGLNLNFRPWSFLTVRGTAGYDVTNQGDNFLNPPNVNPFDVDGQAFSYVAQVRSYTANLAATRGGVEYDGGVAVQQERVRSGAGVRAQDRHRDRRRGRGRLRDGRRLRVAPGDAGWVRGGASRRARPPVRDRCLACRQELRLRDELQQHRVPQAVRLVGHFGGAVLPAYGVAVEPAAARGMGQGGPGARHARCPALFRARRRRGKRHRPPRRHVRRCRERRPEAGADARDRSWVRR